MLTLRTRSYSSFLLLCLPVCAWVLYVAFCQPQIIDGDYWWYLASGDLITRGGIPETNSFSFTHPDYPWKFTQWLFALGLSLVESTAGAGAVEVLFLLVLVATFLLTLDTIRIKSGRIDPWLLLPLMTLAIWASSIRFIIRPHLATLFFLALLLNLMERRPRHLNPVLFLVAAVWTNMHAGFFFGLLTCLAWVAGSALGRDREVLRTSLKALMWFFLGTLVNINLLYPYYYIVSNLWVTQLVPVAEMAGMGNGAGDMRYLPFWMLATFSFACVPLLIKTRDYRTALLLLAFFPLSLFAVRIIPKMILLVLPGVYAAFQKRATVSRLGYSAAVLVLCGSTVVACVASGRLALAPEWGVSTREFPVDAADFIAGNSLKGHMYNGFDEGGYLPRRFYPERGVFIDGRIQAYPPAFLQDYYQANGTPRWQGLMDDYAVDFALIRRQIIADRETFNRGAFLEDLGWPLIYLDGKYLVYARPGRGNDLAIDRHRFELVSWRTPAEEMKSLARSNPSRMRMELMRIPIETLRVKSDVLRFSDAAFYAGDATLCERILRHGLQRFPGSGDLPIKLAALHATQGQVGLAVSELQSVINNSGDAAAREQAAIMLNRVKGLPSGAGPARIQ